MASEIVVYIHGVTPQGQLDHQAQYQKLHEALASKINNPDFPSEFCGVEWGWATPDAAEQIGRAHV